MNGLVAVECLGNEVGEYLLGKLEKGLSGDEIAKKFGGEDISRSGGWGFEMVMEIGIEGTPRSG